MIFQTILVGINPVFSDDEEIQKDIFIKEMKDVPNKQGIFLLCGGTKNYGNCSENHMLYVGITNNLRNSICKLPSNSHRHMIENYYYNSISYAVVENKIEQMKLYLDMIKRYQPKYNFYKEIQEEIQEMENKNQTKSQLIHEIGEENILIEKLGDLNRFTKDIGDFDSCFCKGKSMDDCYLLKDAKCKNVIPANPGIYFIYNSDEELVYIGLSSNIRERLINHLDGHTHTWDIKDTFLFVRFVIIENKNELDDYETYFINRYKPLLNVSKTYTYLHQRYNPKYNKFLQKHGSIENLKRIEYARKLIIENNIHEEIENMTSFFMNY